MDFIHELNRCRNIIGEARSGWRCSSSGLRAPRWGGWCSPIPTFLPRADPAIRRVQDLRAEIVLVDISFHETGRAMQAIEIIHANVANSFGVCGWGR